MVLNIIASQAQSVNVFNESSIGMGDSIGCAKYQVVYDTQQKLHEQGTDNSKQSELMILQIGDKCSAFYSYATYQRDSIIAASLAKGIDISMKSVKGSINWKLYKDYPTEGKTAYLDFFAADKYVCTEPKEDIDWQPTDSTDTICGYTCHQATARFKGRTWTAWYTEDIPLDNGPWKLGGLPGLILKAYDSDMDYSFTAVGLTKIKNNTPIYYKGKTFEPIDRKSLTTLYKKYCADPIGYLFQDPKYANIKVTDKDGNVLKHSKNAVPYNPIER